MAEEIQFEQMSMRFGALWDWFGKNPGDFLILPRVLMHMMPDIWQQNFYYVLNELNEEFPNGLEIDFRVRHIDSKTKRAKTFPRDLCNYRHPNWSFLESFKNPSYQSQKKHNDDLWGWWSITRASFLILPRVVLHEMPDKWQNKTAELLSEFNEWFPGWKSEEYRAYGVDDSNKMVKIPDWLKNYDVPNLKELDRLKNA